MYAESRTEFQLEVDLKLCIANAWDDSAYGVEYSSFKIMQHCAWRYYFIQSFTNYLLNTYHSPSALLSPGELAANQIHEVLILMELDIVMEFYNVLLGNRLEWALHAGS